MKNTLKIAALAFVVAAGLTSCESKPAETTTTEPATTEMAAPMTTDTMSTMSSDSTMMVAPAPATTTTAQ